MCKDWYHDIYIYIRHGQGYPVRSMILFFPAAIRRHDWLFSSLFFFFLIWFLCKCWRLATVSNITRRKKNTNMTSSILRGFQWRWRVIQSHLRTTSHSPTPNSRLKSQDSPLTTPIFGLKEVSRTCQYPIGGAWRDESGLTVDD
jgi:hypothetical protein